LLKVKPKQRLRRIFRTAMTVNRLCRAAERTRAVSAPDGQAADEASVAASRCRACSTNDVGSEMSVNGSSSRDKLQQLMMMRKMAKGWKNRALASQKRQAERELGENDEMAEEQAEENLLRRANIGVRKQSLGSLTSGAGCLDMNEGAGLFGENHEHCMSYSASSPFARLDKQKSRRTSTLTERSEIIFDRDIMDDPLGC